MKKVITLLSAILFIAMVSVSMTQPSEDKEEEAVKELVLKSYVHGAFNALNPQAMRDGFHEDFAIFSPKGEQISKYPIATWAQGVEDKLMRSYDADDPKNKWEPNFAIVDVTGNAAQVKLELYNQGKHVYTDYLSLLKFESGWRIVAKVYQQH